MTVLLFYINKKFTVNNFRIPVNILVTVSGQ